MAARLRAHQGADAAAAPRRRGRLGGSARRARAPAPRVPADPRGGGPARAARRGAPQPIRAAAISRSTRRRPRRRSRSRSPSCSPRWTACCALAREPDLHDVVPRALDVDGAMAVIAALLALRDALPLVRRRRARRRAVAGAVGAARPARTRAPRGAHAPPAPSFRLCGDRACRRWPGCLKPRCSRAAAPWRPTSSRRSIPRRRPPRSRWRSTRSASATTPTGHGVELIELAGGWQILTRAEYTETIERAQLASRPHRLSAAALETLALIAYRQPLGRLEIEEIRGVSVGGMLKTLLERGLIDVVARGEGLGRPLLYGTTPALPRAVRAAPSRRTAARRRAGDRAPRRTAGRWSDRRDDAHPAGARARRRRVAAPRRGARRRRTRAGERRAGAARADRRSRRTTRSCVDGTPVARSPPPCSGSCSTSRRAS